MSIDGGFPYPLFEFPTGFLSWKSMVNRSYPLRIFLGVIGITEMRILNKIMGILNFFIPVA